LSTWFFNAAIARRCNLSAMVMLTIVAWRAKLCHRDFGEGPYPLTDAEIRERMRAAISVARAFQHLGGLQQVGGSATGRPFTYERAIPLIEAAARLGQTWRQTHRGERILDLMKPRSRLPEPYRRCHRLFPLDKIEDYWTGACAIGCYVRKAICRRTGRAAALRRPLAGPCWRGQRAITERPPPRNLCSGRVATTSTINEACNKRTRAGLCGARRVQPDPRDTRRPKRPVHRGKPVPTWPLAMRAPTPKSKRRRGRLYAPPVRSADFIIASLGTAAARDDIDRGISSTAVPTLPPPPTCKQI